MTHNKIKTIPRVIYTLECSHVFGGNGCIRWVGGIFFIPDLKCAWNDPFKLIHRNEGNVLAFKLTSSDFLIIVTASEAHLR